MVDYSVHLADAAGDGWNGNIFGIRQNNTIVTAFGGGWKTRNGVSATTLTAGTARQAGLL